MNPTRDDVVARVARKVKRERLRRKWSGAELGRRIGRTRSSVSLIEAGRVLPHWDTLTSLAKVLGFKNVAELIG